MSNCKKRRHHNKKGQRQVRTGGTALSLRRICTKLRLMAKLNV